MSSETMQVGQFCLTLLQWTAQEWHGFRSRYPDATRTDFDYTQGQREREYWQSVEDAVRSGGGISATVSDRLHDSVGFDYWFNLYQKYPQSFPDAYLCPSARKIQAQHKREMIQARKGTA